MDARNAELEEELEELVFFEPYADEEAVALFMLQLEPEHADDVAEPQLEPEHDEEVVVESQLEPEQPALDEEDESQLEP